MKFSVPAFLLIALVLVGPAAVAVAQQVAPAAFTEVKSTELPGDEARSRQTFAAISKVFVDDGSELIQHHRLVFDSGVTVDLDLLSTREVCVYDPAQNRVTLLDRDRKVQAVVGTHPLITLVASVKAETQKAGVDVGLKSQVTQAGDRLAIGFAGANYQMTTQPAPAPWMAADFATVTDLVLKMNLLRRRGLPPFARMKLGDHVAQLGRLPDETFLQMTQGKQVSKLRATLTIEPLNQQDRDMIAEVRGMMAVFQNVDYDQFNAPAAAQ